MISKRFLLGSNNDFCCSQTLTSLDGPDKCLAGLCIGKWISDLMPLSSDRDATFYQLVAMYLAKTKT